MFIFVCFKTRIYFITIDSSVSPGVHVVRHLLMWNLSHLCFIDRWIFCNRYTCQLHDFSFYSLNLKKSIFLWALDIFMFYFIHLKRQNCFLLRKGSDTLWLSVSAFYIYWTIYSNALKHRYECESYCLQGWLCWAIFALDHLKRLAGIHPWLSLGQ